MVFKRLKYQRKINQLIGQRGKSFHCSCKIVNFYNMEESISPAYLGYAIIIIPEKIDFQ